MGYDMEYDAEEINKEMAKEFKIKEVTIGADIEKKRKIEWAVFTGVCFAGVMATTILSGIDIKAAFEKELESLYSIHAWREYIKMITPSMTAALSATAVGIFGLFNHVSKYDEVMGLVDKDTQKEIIQDQREEKINKFLDRFKQEKWHYYPPDEYQKEINDVIYDLCEAYQSRREWDDNFYRGLGYYVISDYKLTGKTDILNLEFAGSEDVICLDLKDDVKGIKMYASQLVDAEFEYSESEEHHLSPIHLELYMDNDTLKVIDDLNKFFKNNKTLCATASCFEFINVDSDLSEIMIRDALVKKGIDESKIKFTKKSLEETFWNPLEEEYDEEYEEDVETDNIEEDELNDELEGYSGKTM